MKLKGSPLCGENPQPFFRQPDLAVAAGQHIPENKKYSFGRETGFRLLPYTKQDRYNRELVDMEFDSVIMENDFLIAEFIPALGGRLWSLFDKKRSRDIIYRNPVFRPANLAIRDAWFSGGIEWNIGRFGHTVHACSPVFAGILEDEGLTILRLWEFERQTQLFWRIEFILPANSDVLFCYTRIENTCKKDKPLYYWMNAAIPETPGMRVFSACDEVIYIVPGTGKVKTMDYGKLPDLPVLPGKDASYPALSDYSNEYFFQNDLCGENGSQDSLPWESAVYEDGFAYGEMSTLPLTYRKMFCWGSGRGGQRWQDFLTLPEQERYLEVQAGLAPTQLHTSDIKGGQVIDWAEAFTAFKADRDLSHQENYPAAREYIKDQLTKHIGVCELNDALEQGRKRSSMEAKIICMGSGWGALETQLKNQSAPNGLSFPDDSIGEPEKPWAELLRTGLLPIQMPEDCPGSFVVDEDWEKLLKAGQIRKGDWLTPYHLGVIYFENGNVEQAEKHWKESLKQKENPWACRNLALAAIRSSDIQSALDLYRRALCLAGSEDQSFAEEYIPLLLTAGKEDEAAAELDAYMNKVGLQRSNGQFEKLSVPILEAAAKIALNRGDDSFLDKIFSIEQAHLREGNTVFIEIWTEREVRRLCKTGMTRNEAEEKIKKAMADGSVVPPREIDFRMY
ncbi:MAG: DUF5107 domain-containing protein [Treponema sp.]|nr:DUF5107 domain-containing protein [Treponema sp.]